MMVSGWWEGGKGTESKLNCFGLFSLTLTESITHRGKKSIFVQKLKGCPVLPLQIHHRLIQIDSKLLAVFAFK